MILKIYKLSCSGSFDVVFFIFIQIALSLFMLHADKPTKFDPFSLNSDEEQSFYVKNQLEPSSGILHRYNLTNGECAPPVHAHHSGL